MNALLAHDHADLDSLLEDFFAALDAADIERSHVRLDLFWARLGMHIRAEHQHLFPALLCALGVGAKREVEGSPSLIEAQGMIARLRHDHDFFMRKLARAVNQLRGLLGAAPDHERVAAGLQYVRQTVTTVSRRVTEHNQLEEANIYRWAARVLTASEQAQLAGGIRREITNLPPRFTTKA